MNMGKAGIKIGVIGGSGLDDPEILKEAKEIKIGTPFGDTSDKFVTGRISGKDVVVLARHGKGHTITPTNVPYKANIWALRELGCTHILATSACGSLREEIKPKDFVFIDQFIDFTKLRQRTFFDDFKEKIVHVSMAEPFCGKLRQILIESAKKLGVSFHEKGVNITVEGPCFSTRAESHMFRGLGADVVGMTTSTETILARELGICYASIAMATDYDCWRENTEPVTMEMVLKTMEQNSVMAKKLLLDVISGIDFSECSCKNN